MSPNCMVSVFCTGSGSHVGRLAVKMTVESMAMDIPATQPPSPPTHVCEYDRFACLGCVELYGDTSDVLTTSIGAVLANAGSAIFASSKERAEPTCNLGATRLASSLASARPSSRSRILHEYDTSTRTQYARAKRVERRNTYRRHDEHGQTYTNVSKSLAPQGVRPHVCALTALLARARVGRVGGAPPHRVGRVQS